jgi:hypothetical protein
MSGQRMARLSRVKDAVHESHDGEPGRSSRSALVVAILIAVVLACVEREVSGAHEGSLRARLGTYLHHIAVMHSG